MDYDLSLWSDLTKGRNTEHALKGALIEQQFDFKYEIILIKEGIASAFFTLSDGQECIRGLMGPGTFYGIRSCMSHEPYNTSLSAFTDLEYWRISGDAFIEAIQEDKKLFMNYIDYSNHLSLNALHRGEVNALPNNTAKLCAMFLALGDYVGKTSKEGQVIPIKLTHDAIAKLIYSDRVTVSRIISTMEKSEILIRDFGFFVIPDRKKMEEYFFANMK